jgi:hypothetical protein
LLRPPFRTKRSIAKAGALDQQLGEAAIADHELAEAAV